MKKFSKIILASGVTLMLGAGSVSAYLQTQRQEQLSDLTLANIEAMADWSREAVAWANGPSHDVDCARCGSTHVHCEGRKKGTRCLQTSCLN